MNPSHLRQNFLMDDHTLYFCVAKGGQILQSYNARDQNLEGLAALCFASTPPFHSWYSHSEGERTYGFLMEEDFTYFAIVTAASGSLGALRLLKTVRDSFKNSAKNGVHDELMPVLRSLASSLECISRPGGGGAVKIEMPVGVRPLQKSPSAKLRGRRLWCRHVKIVLAADALLCLVLFGVWMMVCRGFHCVSS